MYLLKSFFANAVTILKVNRLLYFNTVNILNQSCINIFTSPNTHAMQRLLTALLIIILLAGCSRSYEALKKTGDKVSKAVSLCTSTVENTAAVSVSVSETGKDEIQTTELEASSLIFGWDTKMMIR